MYLKYFRIVTCEGSLYLPNPLGNKYDYINTINLNHPKEGIQNTPQANYI